MLSKGSDLAGHSEQASGPQSWLALAKKKAGCLGRFRDILSPPAQPAAPEHDVVEHLCCVGLQAGVRGELAQRAQRVRLMRHPGVLLPLRGRAMPPAV